VAIRDDGQLLILDRLNELLKVDGAQVPPAELELVLRDHPAVRDAVVVGRPHPRAGEVPVAYVVLAGPATPRSCSPSPPPRLSAHKRLRDVRVIDRLPRLPAASSSGARFATANAAQPGNRDRTGPSPTQDLMATGRPAAAWSRAVTVAQPLVGAAAAGE
jgi:AMP-binding enzyme C-terminal domain